MILSSPLLRIDCLSQKYSYPFTPIVSSVLGCTTPTPLNMCSPDSDSKSLCCPTDGSVWLTITGRNFGNALAGISSVTVGSKQCSPIQSLNVSTNSSSFECLLPAAVGTDLNVTVYTQGGESGEPYQTISFRVPTLHALSGCSNQSTIASLINCNRTGGMLQ